MRSKRFIAALHSPFMADRYDAISIGGGIAGLVTGDGLDTRAAPRDQPVPTIRRSSVSSVKYACDTFFVEHSRRSRKHFVVLVAGPREISFAKICDLAIYFESLRFSKRPFWKTRNAASRGGSAG